MACLYDLVCLLNFVQEKNEILQKQLDSLSFLSKRKVSKLKIHDTPASTSVQMPTGTVSNSDEILPSQGQTALLTTGSGTIFHFTLFYFEYPHGPPTIKLRFFYNLF